MIIGIPKEIMHGEGRVSATPETVKKLVADGATVLFEKGAGVESYFPDALYAEAGATLVDDVAEVFAKSDVILKVKEPLFNEAKGLHEVDMMHEGQYLITFIHHNELNEVTIVTSRLSPLIENGETAEYLAEVKQAVVLIEHMRSSEQPHWKNIL